MDPIQPHPIRRFEAGSVAAVNDAVVTERRFELDVNDGRLRVGLLCLPQDLEALAVGFLVTEGLLSERRALRQVRVLADEGRIVVRADLDERFASAGRNRWTWSSGCGSGGTSRDLHAAFEPIETGPRIATGRLIELAKRFHARADLWRQTGGVHGCALSDGSDILLFAEDIGRHNAFDKVMGRAFLDQIDPAEKLMLTTGRISADIAAKAATSRLGMVVSRSAVTSLAVGIAVRCNITLVGFLRGQRLNVYSGFWRITERQEQGQ